MNKPQKPSRQRFLVIRRGKEFWEWRHREEGKSAYRTTKIPRVVTMKDALHIVLHDYCKAHRQESAIGAWELTDEEREAGKAGITDAQVDAELRRQDRRVN